MIRLINDISLKPENVENIRILENNRLYGVSANFWKQDGSNLVISGLDGDMTISGFSSDISELKEFLNVLSPLSIFADKDLLNGLGLYGEAEKVLVLKRKADIKPVDNSQALSSREVYSILKESGLSVPKYEFFAVDFCRRLNNNGLKYFGFKDKAVAISIGIENVFLSGVASLEKGLGTVVLKGIISENFGKDVFVCCTKDIEPFYIKNGFIRCYNAGCWRKE